MWSDLWNGTIGRGLGLVGCLVYRGEWVGEWVGRCVSGWVSRIGRMAGQGSLVTEVIRTKGWVCGCVGGWLGGWVVG